MNEPNGERGFVNLEPNTYEPSPYAAENTQPTAPPGNVHRNDSPDDGFLVDVPRASVFIPYQPGPRLGVFTALSRLHEWASFTLGRQFYNMVAITIIVIWILTSIVAAFQGVVVFFVYLLVNGWIFFLLIFGLRITFEVYMAVLTMQKSVLDIQQMMHRRREANPDA